VTTLWRTSNLAEDNAATRSRHEEACSNLTFFCRGQVCKQLRTARITSIQEEEEEAIIKALKAEVVIVVMKSAPALRGVSANSAAARPQNSWITAPGTFSWRTNGPIATSAAGCFGR